MPATLTLFNVILAPHHEKQENEMPEYADNNDTTPCTFFMRDGFLLKVIAVDENNVTAHKCETINDSIGLNEVV
jgi:hypothetical protein